MPPGHPRGTPANLTALAKLACGRTCRPGRATRKSAVTSPGWSPGAGSLRAALSSPDSWATGGLPLARPPSVAVLWDLGRCICDLSLGLLPTFPTLSGKAVLVFKADQYLSSRPFCPSWSQTQSWAPSQNFLKVVAKRPETSEDGLLKFPAETLILEIGVLSQEAFAGFWVLG